MFKGKLFRNLFLIFMCLLTAYFVVMLTTWFKLDSQSRESEYEKQLVDTLEEISVGFDDKIIRIMSMTEQLSTEKEIIDYASRRNRDYGYSALLAMKKILSALNYSGRDYRVEVINQNIGTVVGAGKTTTFSEYVKEIGADADEIKSMLTNFASNKRTQNFRMYKKELKNEKVLLLYSKKEDTAPITIAVLMDKNYLVPDYAILGSVRIECMVSGNRIFSQGSQDERGIKKYHFEEKSKILPDIAMVLTENRYYYMANNGMIFNANIIIGFIILIFMLGLVFFTLNRLYRPLGELVDSIKISEKYASDDEAYILNEKFTALKNRNDELQGQIHSNRQRMKEAYLKDILYGVSKKSELDEKLYAYNLQYLRNKISVALIEFSDFEEIRYVSDTYSISQTREKILTYLKNSLKFTQGSEIFEISYNRFVIMVPGYEEGEIEQIISEELDIVEGYYNINVKCFIGWCNSIDAVSNVYFNILSAIEQSYMKENKNIFNTKDIKIKNMYYYPLELEQKIIFYVVNGEGDKGKVLLQNIINRNYRTSSVADIKELEIAIIMTIKRIVQQIGMHFIEENSDFALPDFSGNETEQELILKVNSCIDKLSSYTNESREKSKNHLMSGILEFIQENYMYDISLADVAEKFNISISYIGKLFRNNGDITFKEYLNKYRIAQAKRILCEDNEAKISDVAKQVGFVNIVSFNRVFKQFEMVSPGEYRERFSDKKQH